LDPIKTNSLTFSIDAVNQLYYANAFSGLNFISRVALSSSTIINDATIRISVHGPEGQLSNPFEAKVATIGSSAIIIDEINIGFNANRMFQITDPQPGHIELEVFTGELSHGLASWRIEILPANYWNARDSSPRTAYQSLAAFSQPNHPSIAKILSAAAQKMQATPHKSGITGYQILEAVDPMAKAIFEAVQDLKLTYSNPPASWSGGPGQKIRTTQEMMDDGFGTCLDTTMLLSACLEEAGLWPLLFLIPGHAFVGYWSAQMNADLDGSIPRLSPVSSVESMANFIDSGRIILIETTKLTSEVTFESSVAAARASLESSGAYEEARAHSVVIDILGCRTADRPVHAMPARYVSPTGEVEIHEYRPPVVDMEMLKKKFAERDAIDGNRVMLNVPTQVRKWLDSLLDLSLRNPLINFGNKKSATRLLIPRESLGTLEDLLQSQKIFQLTPAPFVNDKNGNRVAITADNSRGEVPASPELEQFLNSGLANPNGLICTDHSSPESFVAKMRKTASDAKSIQQETGSNGLYLAIGSLTWKVKQGEIESPLVLIPVTLTPKNRGTAFALSIEESGVTPNFSLVEKLKIEHKINLSGLANLATDRFGIDIDRTLDYVRSELIKEGLQDFRVNATATLGFFNFSSYRLWKDLLDNWQTFDKNPLVHHLIENKGDAFIDPAGDLEPVDLDQLMSELPISADGSQAKAIASAIQGKTFVLQGPPGTGKSQTITNLLSRALDQGKRVLFVAEKRDALDVVKERIDAVGLGAFTLDLHDKNSTSKAVKAQLAEVVDILIEPDKVGFEAAQADYNAALVPLNNYKGQLHEIAEFGESVFSSMERYLSLSAETAIAVPGEYVAQSTQESFEAVSKAIRSMAALGESAGNAKANPWSISESANQLDETEKATLRQVLAKLDKHLTAVEAHSGLKDYILKASRKQINDLKALQVADLSLAMLSSLGTPDSTEQIDLAVRSLEALVIAGARITFDISRVGKIDFGFLENQLQIATTSGFLARGFKVGKLAKQLNALLGVKNAVGKQDLAKSLEQLSGIKRAGSKFAKALQDISSLKEYEDDNLFDPQITSEASKRLSQLVEVNSFLLDPPGNKESAAELVSTLSAHMRLELDGFIKALEELLTLVAASNSSAQRWAHGEPFGKALLARRGDLLRDASEYGFSQLLRWTGLLAEGAPLKQNGLDSVLDKILQGEVSFEAASNSFQKGFYEGLFTNLIVQRGLNTVDGSSVDNHIRKLADAHERLRSRLPRVLGADLLSRRGFDGSMRIGAIGDLMISIKQGRSNLPLREMLLKHWDVISKMTPCVLASPDSAVRFLSAGFEPFDLVVFDEASQIRIANSIGSLGRGKAAIVVGDSQQMPPTSVAQTKTSSTEEEDESEILEESLKVAESILDQCGNARVPEIMLTWHYRSEDESLIAFSNKEYYEGKLSTFPTPSLDHSTRRLSLEVLPGQFIRSASDFESRGKGQLRTNPVEAAAIVRDVVRRLNDPKLKKESIAIVTLNEQQKSLVEAMMLQSKDEALQDALEKGINGEEILVKPLEKVQGSERDVVLISVAFSPRKESPSTLPLNFGPIMTEGGHRRLNVAITRARKEVKVFSSFEPKMLLDRDPASRGLSDLGKFLSMAKATTAEAIEKIATKEQRLDWHRADVARALREAGFIVAEDVGLSDFKVDLAISSPNAPNHAILGVLLDGHRWNQRSTVSDRDALPIKMLTSRMGWAAVERIWLPNWLRDKSGEITRIQFAFEKAKLKAPTASKATSSENQAAPIFTKRSDLKDASRYQETNPFDALLDSVPIWSPLGSTVLGSQEHLDHLHVAKVRAAIASIAEQLSAHEGPVSPARFAKFVGTCFDFNRMVTARAKSINGIPLPGHARDAEGFIFPKDTTQQNFNDWKRALPGSPRPLDEVSITEISNAMVSISKVAQGIEVESLTRETARVFGVQKLSKDSMARLKLAIQNCLAQGALEEVSGYLKVK
jgi:SpoU rRNA methylase family enzyme